VNQENQLSELAKKRVVYELPGIDAVRIRRNVPYSTTEADTLKMDIYCPPESKNTSLQPAVIFVLGYPDRGLQGVFGCNAKEMGSYVSWAQLTAASGMIAITYTNEKPSDVQSLLEYVIQNAESLRVDKQRIGLWACSGNVPMALGLLMEKSPNCIKCAALCYGFMLDAQGSTVVADASKQWGFANPCEDQSVEDLPGNKPLLIARAGKDQMPRLNETIDGFIARALAVNLPLTFVNHPEGPHAFDLMDDSEVSRQIIRQILEFLRFNLT